MKRKSIAIAMLCLIFFNIAFANKVDIGNYEIEKAQPFTTQDIDGSQNCFWAGYAAGVGAGAALAGVYWMFANSCESYIEDGENVENKSIETQENLDFSSFDIN